MIDINITLFIQCINFLISLFFINWLIVSPIRSIMAKRRSEIEHARAEIQGMRDEIDTLLTKYQESISQATSLAKEQRAGTLEKAKSEVALRIEEGKRHSTQLALTFEQELSTRAITLSNELSASVDTFSHAIVQRLVQ